MIWNTSKKTANFSLRGLLRDNRIKLTSIFFHLTAFSFCRGFLFSILIPFLASCSLNPSSPGSEIGLIPSQDKPTKESGSYEKTGKIYEPDQTKSFEAGLRKANAKKSPFPAPPSKNPGGVHYHTHT